jgi:hypothetical protein
MATPSSSCSPMVRNVFRCSREALAKLRLRKQPSTIDSDTFQKLTGAKSCEREGRKMACQIKSEKLEKLRMRMKITLPVHKRIRCKLSKITVYSDSDCMTSKGASERYRQVRNNSGEFDIFRMLQTKTK